MSPSACWQLLRRQNCRMLGASINRVLVSRNPDEKRTRGSEITSHGSDSSLSRRFTSI